MNKKNLLRSLLFLAAFIAVAWFARSRFNIDPQNIRAYILSFGSIGPLIFMGLYAIGPIVVFPTSVLSLAAAFAYGLWPGMLYIVIGATGSRDYRLDHGTFLWRFRPEIPPVQMGFLDL